MFMGVWQLCLHENKCVTYSYVTLLNNIGFVLHNEADHIHHVIIVSTNPVRYNVYTVQVLSPLFYVSISVCVYPSTVGKILPSNKCRG